MELLKPSCTSVLLFCGIIYGTSHWVKAGDQIPPDASYQHHFIWKCLLCDCVSVFHSFWSFYASIATGWDLYDGTPSVVLWDFSLCRHSVALKDFRSWAKWVHWCVPGEIVEWSVDVILWQWIVFWVNVYAPYGMLSSFIVFMKISIKWSKNKNTCSGPVYFQEK